MGTKLHELLAVENQLASTANKVMKETTKTLSEKRSIFSGIVKSHKIFDEKNEHLQQATEHKEIQSTVDEQLDYLSAEIGRYWDCMSQKERTNQKAKADIVIDGKTLATNVPVIVLLSMESKLNELLATYNAIPTLDASRSWVKDEGNAKPNVFKTAHPEERQTGTVEKKWEVIVEATPHHPAQTKEIENRSITGKYVQHDYSSAISSHDKAARLQRLSALIRAVKQARQRANGEIVEAVEDFSSVLFDFINKG